MTPFSTEGTKTRSTFWPMSELVNSTPVSRGLGSMRIQTSANWPGAAGLFLVAVFGIARGLDGLAVAHARLAQLDMDVVTAAQRVGHDFQVQFALGGNDGLMQFRIHHVEERGVFVVQRGQAGGDLVFLALDAGDLERAWMFGLGYSTLGSGTGFLARAEGVAGVRVLEFHHRADVAGAQGRAPLRGSGR